MADREKDQKETRTQQEARGRELGVETTNLEYQAAEHPAVKNTEETTAIQEKELDILPAQKKPKKNRRKRRKTSVGKIAVRIIGIAAVAALAAVGVKQFKERGASAGGEVLSQKTTQVQRMSITSSLSSSGTLSPKDTYNITSLVSGDVISAEFEEGDQVEEGQILYVIDATTIQNEIHSAQNSVERAQSSYNLAREEYNGILNDYSNNTYKSTETGYIKTLYVKAGDKVNSGTKLADIYDDQVMKIKVPFLSIDAAEISVGNEAMITMSNTGEQIGGIVTAVSNMEGTLTGGRLVQYVTIEVSNPGGLTSETSAIAQVGDFLCAQEGCFEPTLDTIMTADIPSSVEIESILVNEGDYVGKGSPFFVMTSKSAENLTRGYKNSMDQAQEALESAQNKLENSQNSYENYTITAPISGTVITKNTKAGDKISANNNSAATLAVIYDLSQLTFEMSVDELDVQSVKVGQQVQISADAFEGQRFSGTVTNVSLASSYSNGVTNYPVTVTLEESGNLLPGMNVDGNIILSQAENVLVVPVDCLMRGNRVYVKDDSVTEAQGAVPAGFRAVEVETGLMNDDYVEIISGLSEGEEIYVSESSTTSGFQMMPGMGGPGGMGGNGGGNGNRPGGNGGNGGGNGGGPMGPRN